MEEDEPGKDHEQGAAHQEILSSEISEKQLQDARDQHHEAEYRASRSQGLQLVALVPDEEPGEERHEEAVRVVGIIPPLERQIAYDAAIQER